MAVDTRPQVVVSAGKSKEPDDPVGDLVRTLRPRLGELPEDLLHPLVTAALDELGEVRVRTYLPIIVERMVRARITMPARDALRLPA
jgi:hypothetical protein